ncbi:KR domain-containing protein [Bisporella sp. PMI_857]|nr:KR domain-containing protein [Bisporella sp. PMI_857]
MSLPLIPPQNIRSAAMSNGFLTFVDWKSDLLPFQLKPINPTNIFRGDRTYLLVGLTGELGQSLCRWMVVNGVRHVALSSWSPQVGLKWQQELRNKGSRVSIETMDVADKNALIRLKLRLQNSWPPIAGISNGAMALSDSSFNNMSLKH